MPSVELMLRVPAPTSFRAAQVRDMFDVPTSDASERIVRATLGLEGLSWQIGVIIGPSGSGKSTIARALWPEAYCTGFDWPGACLLYDFPVSISATKIGAALSAVGFASVPAWLLPYHAFSTGQQFRATLARALLSSEFIVFDEYTSVVDRIVAKSASTALAKWVRRTSKQFVAVTCHDDIVPWLEADWVYDMATETFSTVRLRRPRVGLSIHAGTAAAWPLFKHHHYLTAALNPSAKVFLGYVTLDGLERLAAFTATLPAMGMAGWSRESRTVVLPDYQGLGVGTRIVEAVGEHLWQREHRRLRSVTPAPGIIAHRRRHPEMWRCVAGPGMKGVSGNRNHGVQTSAGRLTTSWEYIPEGTRAT